MAKHDYPPPLPLADELDLVRRYRDGDRASGQKAILHSMQSVVRRAKRMAKYSHDLDEMVQEGAVALARTLPLFDPDMGVSLAQFARKSISNRMTSLALAKTAVDGPGTVNLRYSYISARRMLEECGEEASPAAVFAHLAWRPGTELAMRRLLRGTLSLSSVCGGGDDDDRRSIGETIPGDDPEPTRSPVLWDRVLAAIENLSPKEKWVIYRRFLSDGEPPTLEEVGAELPRRSPNGEWGVHRETVRNIQERAIRKIRRAIRQAAVIRSSK